MKVATIKSMLALQATNVIGLPFIHSAIKAPAKLTFQKKYRSTIQKQRSNGGADTVRAKAHST